MPSLQRRHQRKSSKGPILEDELVEGARPRLTESLRRAASLPIKVAGHLPSFPILLLIAVFNGIVNMILSSLGSLYQEVYQFPAETAGLSYLWIGVGGLSALAVTKSLKRAVTFFSKSLRLSSTETSLLFIASVLPVSALGLLWFGWAVQKQNFWIIPILGLYMFGFGWMTTRVRSSISLSQLLSTVIRLMWALCLAFQLSTQIFLIEIVPGYTASALAAHTIASSLGGALIPLSTYDMYDRVGYGWGNTIIAGINMVLCLIPVSMFSISKKMTNNWDMKLSLQN